MRHAEPRTERGAKAARVTAMCLLVLAGCVLGFRGKAGFQGVHEIAGIDEIRIRLPDTPVDIVGCVAVAEDPELCPEQLSYRGVWSSIGGSANDAEANAARPSLQFVREAGFAELSAVVPLAVAGLVDLEIETMTLPGDRDLQVVGGLGDVSVDGVSATVSVVVDVGDVEVRGGDEGVAVTTGQGAISVVTAGHADLRTSRGAVEVEQRSGARDLFVDTGVGDITVTLLSDADVELTVRAPGTIRVDTPQITAVTRGEFNRRLGTGSVRIELTTDAGAVWVHVL